MTTPGPSFFSVSRRRLPLSFAVRRLEGTTQRACMLREVRPGRLPLSLAVRPPKHRRFQEGRPERPMRQHRREGEARQRRSFPARPVVQSPEGRACPLPEKLETCMVSRGGSELELLAVDIPCAHAKLEQCGVHHVHHALGSAEVYLALEQLLLIEVAL